MSIVVFAPRIRPNARPDILTAVEALTLRTGDTQQCLGALKKIKDCYCHFRCDCGAEFAPRYTKGTEGLHYVLVSKVDENTPGCVEGCFLRQGHARGDRAIGRATSALRVPRFLNTIDLLAEPQEVNAPEGTSGSPSLEEKDVRGTRQKRIVSLLLQLLDSSELNTKRVAFHEPCLISGFGRLSAELRKLQALPSLNWGELTFPSANHREPDPLKFLTSIFKQTKIDLVFKSYNRRPKGLILGVADKVENGLSAFRYPGGRFEADLTGAMITGIGRTGPYLCLLGVVEREGKPVITQVAKHAILNRGVLLPVESHAERAVAFYLERAKLLDFKKPVFENKEYFRPDFIVNDRIWIEVQGMDLPEYLARKKKRLEEVETYCKANGNLLVRYDDTGDKVNDMRTFEKDLKEKLIQRQRSS